MRRKSHTSTANDSHPMVKSFKDECEDCIDEFPISDSKTKIELINKLNVLLISKIIDKVDSLEDQLRKVKQIEACQSFCYLLCCMIMFQFNTVFFRAGLI